MITSKMMKFLEDYTQRMAMGKKKTVQDSVYINRMQKRIDRELKKGLWLARNHREVFLGGSKASDSNRLKTILFIIKLMNPKIDVELVLKNLKPEGEKHE